MGVPGSSPRWREFEARILRPPVRQLVHSRAVPDKRALCERFCAKRGNFLEIRLRRAKQEIVSMTAPVVFESKRWTVREIVRLVAEKHAMTPGDLLSETHNKLVVIARHEAFYDVARLMPGLSLPQIGKAFSRDPTTVRHGIMCHIERGAARIRGLNAPKRGEGYRPKASTWTYERLGCLVAMKEQGHSRKSMAERFGARPSSIKWAMAYARRRGLVPKSR